MAEKPPGGYISVVDEEPEILELLKWDGAQQMQKPQEQPPPQTEKTKTSEKRTMKHPEIDPFELQEPNFIETYRLTKDLARSLCEELKPVMPECSKTVEVSVESKVLAALAYFATGKYQKTIGGKSDPAISSYFVSASVMQVTQALNHPTIVKKYIHFPHLREERDVIKARLHHVPIPKPEEDLKSHFNKSYHSKKVQIICDSDLTILSVDPSPGSHSHDGILQRHAVRVDLESLNLNQEQCLLIGGPYYSLKPYLMTPIPKITKKSAITPEKYYNNVHTTTHNSVLETIKHLKSRGIPICAMTSAEERLEIMKQKVALGPIPKKLNDDAAGNKVREDLIKRLWNERRVDTDSNANGRKKRAKNTPTKPPPLDVQVMQVQHHQPQIQDIQVLTESHASHQDDASKRPRMTMHPPPTYSLLQPAAWGLPTPLMGIYGYF
ncbi:DDE superfamily endonuclease domain-containing protein [Phthorimaea operculella]|nr:DDE superfamily endonuclease domain-containing protein [Phthorimaea operculella]